MRNKKHNEIKAEALSEELSWTFLGLGAPRVGPEKEVNSEARATKS